jgi:AcrR family transcriptional regulator
MSLMPSDTSLPASSRSRRVAARGGARVAPKGQQTRASILEAALPLAAQMGLEGLSIGALAEVTGMSKSGVFAHFGSREELQISVIREYHQRFEQEVFFAAIRAPRSPHAPVHPPLRDMQFVLHEMLDVETACKEMPRHAEVDADTDRRGAGRRRQVLRRGGVPAQPQRRRARAAPRQGHGEVRTPKGFKEAYAQFVEGGWPALSCDPEYGGQGLPHTGQPVPSTRC